MKLRRSNVKKKKITRITAYLKTWAQYKANYKSARTVSAIDKFN